MLKEVFGGWKVAERLPEKLLEKHREIPESVLGLLYNRQVFSLRDSKKEIEKKVKKFLYPSFSDLLDPFLMKDLKKAVQRIRKALKIDEKIAVFGDYDADGITATTLLFEVFRFFNKDVLIYIPHRDKEGYGLNSSAIKKISKKKVKLLITVDCGIRNIKEVEEAKKLGMDVIITDHHEILKKVKTEEDMVPNALVVLNPKQKKCRYPFKKLAGVGVAFKLAQGLLSGNKKGEAFLKWLLDLVAIGTIGDCVPLVSENRTLVKFGLLVFDKTRRQGILELKKSIKNGKQDLGFCLAPRLNAAGRMDHANWAFWLLKTRSKIEALKLARKIEELNQRRQEVTDKVIEEAKKELDFLRPSQKIIILAKENWPSSVLGIVAGRLAEEYGRPALVIERGKKISKGSARSIPGFDINKALEKIGYLFEKVGGHKEAAGFVYKTKNHNKISSELLKEAFKEIKTDFKPPYLIDSEIKTEDLNPLFYRNLQLLAPFGESNWEPLFLMKGVKILEKRRVGLNEHLKLRLEKDGKKIEAIAFRKGNLEDKLKEDQNIDFIFKLRENFYLGVPTVQMEIIDLRPGEKEEILCSF